MTKRQRRTLATLGSALLIALLLWLGDSLYLLHGYPEQVRGFPPGTAPTLWDALGRGISTRALVLRLIVTALCLAGGLVTSQYAARHRQSRSRYRELLDSIPVGICILVPGERRVIECNQAALQITGHPNRATLQEHMLENFTSHKDYQTLLDTLRNRGSVHDLQLRLKRPDGPVYHASLTIVPTKLEGEAVYIATVQDITQRIEAEEATHEKRLQDRENLDQERARLARAVEEQTAELRRANAELARAARLKNEFLANVSHELRTPLTVILTFTEMLRGGLYGTMEKAQQKALHAIDESGHHLLTLINDILDLSRIEAEKLDLDIEAVSVPSVCESSLHMIQHQARAKAIEVKQSIDENAVYINADGRRLKQILVNLLSNAVKFTPKGGQVGLEVHGDAESKHLHFVVWDTGIGIAPEDVDRLFQPFSQLDGGLTRQYEGTGLGLAMVYRLTELHGGSVAVESELDRGSRFTVSLPWEPESVERIVKPASDAAPQRVDLALPAAPPEVQHTILLVEDNRATARPLQKYLSASGYKVLQAWNGAQGVEVAQEEHPDLILMDIQMPVMNGLEAIQHIRADATMAQIPIIALTALVMPGDRDRCLEAGASAYLSKPISLVKLKEAIELHLDGK